MLKLFFLIPLFTYVPAPWNIPITLVVYLLLRKIGKSGKRKSAGIKPQLDLTKE